MGKGTALKLGGCTKYRKIIDDVYNPTWIKNYKTVKYLNTFMQSQYDDIISKIIGKGYHWSHQNILYNTDEVLQQKYHRDYKPLNYSQLAKEIDYNEELCNSDDDGSLNNDHAPGQRIKN